jgi:sulfite exporter TauE/SafE
MPTDISSLSVAAVSLGFLHCIGGPDHYLPFVAMSRVGVWSLRKTLLVTLFCGIGHVAGTAALGFLAVAAGLLVYHVESSVEPFVRIESVRADLAAWLLMLFGAAYSSWGLWQGKRRAQRADENADSHGHRHAKSFQQLTPWVLFTIFVFGPCEPLIPLLMYPAAKASLWNVAVVTLLFGGTTLITMTAIVAIMHRGLDKLQLQWLEAHSHTLAGLVLFACGLAMVIGL